MNILDDDEIEDLYGRQVGKRGIHGGGIVRAVLIVLGCLALAAGLAGWW